MNEYTFSGYRDNSRYSESAIKQGLINPTIYTVQAENKDIAFAQAKQLLKHHLKLIDTKSISNFNFNLPEKFKQKIESDVLAKKISFLPKDLITSDCLAYIWQLMNGYTLLEFENNFIALKILDMERIVHLYVNDYSITIINISDASWYTHDEANQKCMAFNRSTKMTKASYDYNGEYRQFISFEFPYATGLDMTDLCYVIKLYAYELQQYEHLLD